MGNPVVHWELMSKDPAKVADNWDVVVIAGGHVRGSADYERFVGNDAKLKTRQPIGGQRNFRGRLLGVQENDLIFEDRTNGRVRIPLDIIAKANLEVDLNQELRRGGR